MNGMINKEMLFSISKKKQKKCRSDVKVLAMGVLKFRQIYYNEFDVDPFRYITISSLCMNLFKCKFMSSNTIVSNDANKPISKISREYFIYLDNPDILREHPLHIKLERLNCNFDKNKILYDGETEHKRYYKGHTAKFVVDGLKHKTVYEFNGCKFHGCRKCFPNEIGVYNRTMEKLNILEAAGYKVISISECDWYKIKAELSSERRKAIDKQATDEHINIRDALFGGRTECFKSFVKCEGSQKILSFDVCSMYPSVNALDDYAVGFKNIINQLLMK